MFLGPGMRCATVQFSHFAQHGFPPPADLQPVILSRATMAWIPFGDHPLKLERHREDQHGPCARMTRTNREEYRIFCPPASPSRSLACAPPTCAAHHRPALSFTSCPRHPRGRHFPLALDPHGQFHVGPHYFAQCTRPGTQVFRALQP